MTTNMERIVLPPSIMPVIIVKGSNYEMGFQYGQQAAPYVYSKKEAAWARALRELETREKIIREVKATQYYVKQDTPEAVEQMVGLAEGAKMAGYDISYLDVVLMNTYKPAPADNYPPGAEDQAVLQEGCSVWSAWGRTTADGKLICAKSCDSEFEPQVVIVAFPQEGHSFLATTPAGELCDSPAMNTNGVFLGRSGGYARRRSDIGYGVHVAFATQHLLQFADSAVHAKDMYVNWKYTRGINVQISDVNGDACVVEMAPSVHSVRKAGDYGEADFIYSTNNYFSNTMKETILGEAFIEHGGWLGRSGSIHSIPRNLQLWNMLHNYSGKVTLEFAEMMWRFPGNPPPYPHDQKTFESMQGEGWDQKICNQDTRRIGIMLPDRGEGGLAYICTGPAGRVAHPLYPEKGHWYQISPTHTFFQLALRSSPLEVVEAARDEAHRCIAEAHRGLMGLNYTDVGYGFLNGIFSRANAEYYEGIGAYHKAILAAGNEALRYFAMGATAFTRAQAHAKQVCDALHPPASKPDDLGLKPYGGPWATWATR